MFCADIGFLESGCFVGAVTIASPRSNGTSFRKGISVMAIPIPSLDGEISLFNLSNSTVCTPKIYFVNGVRVIPREHSVTASCLSLLVERPIWGVYNSTGGVRLGSIVDFLECLQDYSGNVAGRLSWPSNRLKPRLVPEHKIGLFLSVFDLIPIVSNKATKKLFISLVENRHSRQMIIAHSQGNLITSNALFLMEAVLGSDALNDVRVYSLASPAPAWPIGLRKKEGKWGGRQDNAFMNDFIALLRPHNLAAKLGYNGFQNKGDFRTHEKAKAVAIKIPHATPEIIGTLNFLKSIRNDLGLSKEYSPRFVDDSFAKAADLIPLIDKRWWEYVF
jgi:hypothetical protein